MWASEGHSRVCPNSLHVSAATSDHSSHTHAFRAGRWVGADVLLAYYGSKLGAALLRARKDVGRHSDRGGARRRHGDTA